MTTSDNTTAVITARNLTRTFRVPVRDTGLRASLKALVRREFRTVEAVSDVSFTINRGEVVGFLGPNGAGKTTTLKMLSGLMHPTSGDARVLGVDPARRDHDHLKRIALVMGNRQQLAWDIPAHDSFEMLRTIYQVPRNAYRTHLDELVELLHLDGIIDKPVRQLSLGERMKCELAAALLHAPEILFLDEPTLGLDVEAQRRVREFIAAYAARNGATVLLTSHYMADIEALASRVLVIHHGRLQFDGELRDLVQRMSDRKRITARLDPAVTHAANDVRDAIVGRGGAPVHSDDVECVVDVARDEVRDAMAALVRVDGVLDFTVEDEPLDGVIERVFAQAEPRPA